MKTLLKKEAASRIRYEHMNRESYYQASGSQETMTGVYSSRKKAMAAYTLLVF